MAGKVRRPTNPEVHDLKIILVRHGHHGGEDPGGGLGRLLTPLGTKQAARLARRLAKGRFAHIYSSDLTRAHQTALAVRKFHPNTRFTLTPALREINGRMTKPGRASGGRAVYEKVRRRRAEIQKFAKQLIRNHARDDQVLIVAHGNLIRFLVSTLAGVNPKAAIQVEISNTSISEAIVRNGKFLHLYRSNDLGHLLPHQVT